MRKKPFSLILLFVSVLLSLTLFSYASASAQTEVAQAEEAPGNMVFGPIGQYAFTNATDTYTPLTGDTPFAINGGSGSLDDGISATQTLPFTFNFGGTDFTTYRVNSNGWLGFGAPTATTNYSALSGTVNNVIAFVSRDMNNTGAVYSSVTEGVAPNRIHKIQAQNFYRYDVSSNTGNAQIWLYEGSNVIEIRYGAFATWTNTTGTAQVGLRGASSAAANMISLSGSGTGAWQNVIAGNSSLATVSLFGSIVPDSGRVYRFEPVLLGASTKTASPLSFVRIGDVIDYQIVVRNGETITATAVNMSDPIPVGTIYVPGSLATDGSPVATYDMGTNTIQWGTADLSPGTAVTVTFQVTVTTGSSSNIVNNATINASNMGVDVVRSATTPFVGCADDQFYTCADSLTPGGPAFTWYSAISGTLLMDTSSTWDDGAANVTLPFPFTYYGNASTDLRVGNNGAMLFGATTGVIAASNTAMSTAPANLIAPFWDDLDNDTGGVYYDTFGSEPNRIFVVEWNNRPRFNNIGAGTFQVLFFEGTNEIVFQYQDVDFGNALYDNGASATVGIKGNTIQYSFNQPALSDGLAIQFTPIPQPAITLTKTVGTDPGECALSDAITLPPSGGEVTYCFTVENTGEVTFAFHDLEDSEFGDILTGFSYSLIPGESVFLTQTATITATTVNTATWTAYNAGPSDLVTATDTATVTVPDSAFVRVAHLAPFAMDPGTAVTITLDGVPALTNFAYGDSTPYIQVAAGNVFVEVFPEGSATAAISDTLALTLGTYYTVVALGDGTNQDLDLLALEDDNTAPAAGQFHLRLGHLAPFAPGLATADIRLQDGTPVITDVNFSDVTGYLPLPAGTYDLKITTPGGGTTLIDPAPVDFAEGAIVTAFATGEGSNQDLGVFAYPVDVEGFFLRLAVAEIALTKTVGTDSSVCATTDEITVSSGTTVYYCYEVTNTGDLTLNLHDLVDDQLGTIFSGFNYALAPNSSVNTVAAGLSIPAVITATTINTATWTAYNAGPTDVATASDTATVTVVTASNGLPMEDFNAGTAGFPPAGWSVINNGGTCVWQSTETTGYANLTGGDGFAVEANSDDCGSGTTMNTELRTPFFNLTGATSPVLTYRYDYRDLGVADQGTVDISTDGGATWINLVTYLVNDRGPAQNVVDLSAYVAEPLLQVRFTYFAPGWDWWFQVDDVTVLLESAPEIAVDPDALASSQLADTINTLSLNIANAGTAALNWEISEAPVSCATPDDIPWLSVAPITGTIGTGEDATVTVTFDSTGLAVGTYNGFLCVESDDPVMPVVAVPVELTVEVQPTIDIDLTTISATVTSGGQITAPMTISNIGTGSLDWNITETAPARVPTDVLYDNGPLVTHPGAGGGGADESRLQSTSLTMNTIGFGNQFSVGNRMADDFTVPAGGWALDSLTVYHYQTGSTTTSTITGLYLQIWDGPPNDPTSTVIFGDLTTNRMISTGWSNIYRTTETTIGNTTRPIMASVADLGGIFLPAGDYWFDWMANGSLASGPWAPPITILGQTTTGNALQFTSGAWATAVDGVTLTPQGMPFVITGAASGCSVPEDVPWLSVLPSSGSTAAGGSSNVTVTLDSTGLDAGNYEATLCINSNDPVEPLVEVPVELEVTAVLTPDISLTKTVGTEPGVCAATDTLTVMAGTDVYYCYEVENTGNVTLNLHDLEDDELGEIFAGLSYVLMPGSSVNTVAAGLTISATMNVTTTNTAIWTAYNAGPTDVVTATASATVNVTPLPMPAIEIVKTVGTEEGVCAATSEIAVQSGTTVYYCYTVTNTGNVTLNVHDLDDDVLGEIFTGFPYTLTSGSSVNTVAAGLTISATITETTTNMATWTAYNAGPVDVATATASATVTVIVYKLYLPIVMKP